MTSLGFCYICDKQVQLQSNPVSCSDCNSEFIEVFELNETVNVASNAVNESAILSNSLNNPNSDPVNEENVDTAQDDSNQKQQPLAKIRKLEETDLKKDKEAESVCPICFDDWTNAGDHRLVSLKCGHLFGESCIKKWIRGNGKCAQCNQYNEEYDVRRIFASTLKVADTAELEKEKKLRMEITAKYENLLKSIEEAKRRAAAGTSVFSSGKSVNPKFNNMRSR